MKTPQDFYPLCLPIQSPSENNVDPVTKGRADEENYYQFVEDYFKSLGLPKPRRIIEPALYSFKSVSLHTDYPFQNGVKTIVFPIKGKGELGHMTDGKIETDVFWAKSKKKWKPLFLDDQKPHCFLANVRCYAVLVNVDEKSWEAARKIA